LASGQHSFINKPDLFAPNVTSAVFPQAAFNSELA